MEIESIQYGLQLKQAYHVFTDLMHQMSLHFILTTVDIDYCITRRENFASIYPLLTKTRAPNDETIPNIDRSTPFYVIY
jgi:hypothetical protein